MPTMSLVQRFGCAPSARGAVIVTRDGLPVVVTTTPEAYLHAATPSSVDWAIAHEGWAILTSPTDDAASSRFRAFQADLRGAHHFVTLRERRGYGMAGRAVRLTVQAVELASDLFTDPDYVAASDVLHPLCSAASGALVYLDGDGAAIRGMLDSAIRAAMVRGGLTFAEADAL